MRYWKSSAAAVAVAVVAVFAAPVGAAEANVTLTRVSSDQFTNSTSQHATEVEPDTFAHGSTVVGAFQVGRFFNGGSTDIGFARSGDGGATWGTTGFLPGLTFSSGAAVPYERVSDPSVAFDAKHGTWLISSIPLLPNLVVPTVFVSRSTDDGQTWSLPVTIPPPAAQIPDQRSCRPVHRLLRRRVHSRGRQDSRQPAAGTSSERHLRTDDRYPCAGRELVTSGV